VPVMRDLTNEGLVDIEVVAAWDSGETRPEGFAKTFAKDFNIPYTPDTLEEMLPLVDGVIVHTTNWDKHLEQARIFVEANKAVYLDKPVAGNLEEINQILDWIKQGKRVTGGSVLRFCREVIACRDEVAAAGETIYTGYSCIGVDDYNYGIHGYATLIAAMGPEVLSVQYIGSSNQKQILIKFSNGRVGILTVGKTKWLPFNLTATTGSKVHQVAVDNMQLYRAMLEKVMPYFTGKTDEVPLEATSLVMPELTALAAKQSWLNNGAEVFITDIAKDISYDGGQFAREYRRARLG
jgi:hypothetical protein